MPRTEARRRAYPAQIAPICATKRQAARGETAKQSHFAIIPSAPTPYTRFSKSICARHRSHMHCHCASQDEARGDLLPPAASSVSVCGANTTPGTDHDRARVMPAPRAAQIPFSSCRRVAESPFGIAVSLLLWAQIVSVPSVSISVHPRLGLQESKRHAPGHKSTDNISDSSTPCRTTPSGAGHWPHRFRPHPRPAILTVSPATPAILADGKTSKESRKAGAQNRPRRGRLQKSHRRPPAL